MAATWMWGWELGVDILTYSNSGWGVINSVNVEPDNANPYQPALGYGGGRYALMCEWQQFGSTGAIMTPGTGENSIGTLNSFIFEGSGRWCKNVTITLAGFSLLSCAKGLLSIRRWKSSLVIIRTGTENP